MCGRAWQPKHQGAARIEEAEAEAEGGEGAPRVQQDTPDGSAAAAQRAAEHKAFARKVTLEDARAQLASDRAVAPPARDAPQPTPPESPARPAAAPAAPAPAASAPAARPAPAAPAAPAALAGVREEIARLRAEYAAQGGRDPAVLGAISALEADLTARAAPPYAPQQPGFPGYPPPPPPYGQPVPFGLSLAYPAPYGYPPSAAPAAPAAGWSGQGLGGGAVSHLHSLDAAIRQQEEEAARLERELQALQAGAAAPDPALAALVDKVEQIAGARGAEGAAPGVDAPAGDAAGAAGESKGTGRAGRAGGAGPLDEAEEELRALEALPRDGALYSMRKVPCVAAPRRARPAAAAGPLSRSWNESGSGWRVRWGGGRGCRHTCRRCCGSSTRRRSCGSRPSATSFSERCLPAKQALCGPVREALCGPALVALCGTVLACH